MLLWSAVLHADGFMEIIGCMCLIAVAIPVSIGLRLGISERWRNILSPLVSKGVKAVCSDVCCRFYCIGFSLCAEIICVCAFNVQAVITV